MGEKREMGGTVSWVGIGCGRSEGNRITYLEEDRLSELFVLAEALGGSSVLLFTANSSVFLRLGQLP